MPKARDIQGRSEWWTTPNHRRATGYYLVLEGNVLKESVVEAPCRKVLPLVEELPVTLGVVLPVQRIARWDLVPV